MPKTSISTSIRLFKQGLDREIVVYWKSFVEKGWEVFWGPTLAGVAFGLYTLWHAPALPWFLGYVLIVTFLTGYYLWRVNHSRLLTATKVTEIRSQSWDHQTGARTVLYFFEVVNTSEAETIHNVSVQLAGIEPPVDGMGFLPIPLRQKHDWSFPAQAARTFDLNPGERKHIDLISGIMGGDFFDLHHIVPSVNARLDARSRHKLNVLISGKDIPGSSVWFDVWAEEGVLKCDLSPTA